MGKASGGVVNPILFTLDFTAATLGAMSNASFVSSFALAFARASAATVQTSGSAVDSTPTTDQPRFGSNGATGIRGLVIEETRTNDFWYSRDPTNGAAWAAGVNVTTTANAANGPDGNLNACRHQVASNGFSRSQTVVETNGSKSVFTEWIRGTSATSPYQLALVSSAANYVPGSTGTTFQRISSPIVTIAGGAATGYPCDATDNGGVGACDVLTDFHQLEIGSFATEAIVTAGGAGTRAGERVYDSSASRWVDANRLSVEFIFAPKATPANYSANAFLWYIDASNNAWMDTAQKLNVKVGGTTVTSASAISWTAGQVVGLWIEAGGGAACKVEYRTSSDGGATYGSVTTLINAALAGTLSPPTLDLFCNGTANQLTAYIKTITAYRSGQKPAWVV